MKGDNPRQPLSGMRYAVISLVGLIVSAVFTVFYMNQVPKLVESGIEAQVFYLLLIPWALSAVVFLFGLMESYARFTHKETSGSLRLGGPIVAFFLVVWLGFTLVPRAPESFDLTVRVHSQDGSEPIITSGNITIDLGTTRRTERIGANGEANFKGVPFKFSGASFRVLPQVNGYEANWQEEKPLGNVIDLSLVREQPEIVLTGLINPPPPKGKKNKIIIDGQKGEASPDEFGRFEITVSGKAGGRIRLKVFEDGKLAYDDFQTLPGPVTITLHPK